jgi:hypothetical protein
MRPDSDRGRMEAGLFLAQCVRYRTAQAKLFVVSWGCHATKVKSRTALTPFWIIPLVCPSTREKALRRKPSSRPNERNRNRQNPTKLSSALFKIDHSLSTRSGYYFPRHDEKGTKSTTGPYCPLSDLRSRAGEKCELSSGQPRSEPHRDRRVIAKDQP